MGESQYVTSLRRQLAEKEAVIKELVKEGEGRNIYALRVLTENEELKAILHNWHFLWNEGELTFEPLQWTQEGFEDLVAETRAALHRDA